MTRRAEVNRQGKLGLEPKDRMKSRGLASPDRADAVLGAIACGGGIGGSWERYDAISRPTVSELYEEASLLADDIGAPSGANAGC